MESQDDAVRPFTIAELKQFSREPYVHLGNHTHDHAILTNYSDEQVGEQIGTAQRELTEITGEMPKIISYPNGNCSESIVRIAREQGLRIGLTVEPMKNRLPIRPEEIESMYIGRFMLEGNTDIRQQCRMCRAGIMMRP